MSKTKTKIPPTTPAKAAPKKLTAAQRAWRPCGWQLIEEGVDMTPAENMKLYDSYEKAGYYAKKSLSKKGGKQRDADEALIVLTNAKRLRDAWNTHGAVWQLGAKLTGVQFKTDPFYNPGTDDLPGLVVRLDGSGDVDDLERASNGLAVEPESFAKLLIPSFVNGEVVTKGPEAEHLLPKPLHWRGHGKRALKPGECPAAVNGPHSSTERWLKLCVAYGQEDICVAFVPDRGDGWIQRWSLTAQLVVRLGRVPCKAPPGIEIQSKVSSPQGSNALLVWVPRKLRTGLPKESRECISKGKGFRVPLLRRPRAGIQYAFVQPGAAHTCVDYGLVG